MRDDVEQIESEATERVVVCPSCFQETDSLKMFRLLNLVCMVIIWTWSFESVVACPSCMRKTLLSRLGSFIVVANVGYPWLAISHLIQLSMTRTKGHTDPVAEIGRAHV